MSLGDLFEQEKTDREMLNRFENEKKMYLQLYHGRTSPEQNLDDWGSSGPVFGPLQWFHVTYLSSFRFCYENEPTGDTSGEFFFVEDLLHYDGVYYGDWSVFMSNKENIEESYAGRLQTYEEEKAVLR